jgi:2-polyprenyl-3-methyl-5-hydroxy-6-metoxy-1,4-benzoquinol methylase
MERLFNVGFRKIHGIDIDLSALGSSHATASTANLDEHELGLGHERYGLISAIEVIEHMENPGRFFSHMQTHLAKDGLLLLTSPNVQSLRCRLRFLLSGKLQQFDEKADPTHISPMLFASLERILAKHNLEIAERWSFPEDGSSTISRPAVRRVSRLLSAVLPNQFPGDIICLLIRKM